MIIEPNHFRARGKGTVCTLLNGNKVAVVELDNEEYRVGLHLEKADETPGKEGERLLTKLGLTLDAAVVLRQMLNNLTILDERVKEIVENNILITK